MNANNSLIAAALALALTVGATSAAYAWGGGFEHHGAPNHRIAEHGPRAAQSAPQGITLAFEAHGGGHEQAPNNKSIHETEMRDPGHQDRAPQTPAPAYEQHGGGHEQAADNAAIHEREMKDPNHRD